MESRPVRPKTPDDRRDGTMPTLTEGREREKVMRSDKLKNKFLIQTLKHYQLRNELLYFSPHKLDFTRLVVPRYDSLRVDILHDYHDSVVAGHMRMDKTYEGIQRDYYWPNMANDIRKYVETCDECQRNKASTHAPYGLLNPLPIPI